MNLWPHWALDLSAVCVILAVTVPIAMVARYRPHRPRHRAHTRRPDWIDPDLWDTGVHHHRWR